MTFAAARPLRLTAASSFASLLPITAVIRTNPLAQFADWKLASDDAGLKGEAYLPRKELIRKDAFPYQCLKIHQ